jgi:tetrahydrodipicolinate N-succinyltransferase
MEEFDNETIIKNINEFKLLITTQKQYVINTQHENNYKNLELKYKDQEIKNKEEEIKKLKEEDIKKLKDDLNKNYIKKKVYKEKNRILEEENKNLKNQLDFLKNLILFNNTNINKPFLNQTVNYTEKCTEMSKVKEPDIKDTLKIEDIEPKILEKKKVNIDTNKLNMGNVLNELKNKFNK